uniref:Reverse transcriptase domain-containing protein n=1 Tax=Leptobrachium leishanense TaxID=445787 RepID=A0A8C5M7Y9_9ANUR
MMTLTSPLYRTAAPTWRLNDFLLSDPTVIRDCTLALEHYFTENTNPDLSPLTIWEAHKCVVRGFYIQKASEFKRQRSTAISDALTRIVSLETLHKGSLDPDDLIELTAARRDLTTLLNSSYHRQCQRSKMFFFANGDKSGRLLARMLQKRRAASYIAKIRDSHKKLHYLPGDIQSTIRTYYESLYNLPGLPPGQDRATNRTDIRDYLTTHLKCRLPQSTARLLESPLSTEELAGVLKTSKTGKCPGPDGLPLNYYKQFLKTLSPHFLLAFNSVPEGRLIPPQTLAANITLIPKDGKDTEQCGSYRPISLLNCDLKLFAKILASRLLPHITDLIHPDQTGFIPGREARDNTIRALTLTHRAQRRGEDLLLLSTDAEKAFDRVNWDFFIRNTRIYRSRPTFMCLYINPTARVCVNGMYTAPFGIRNGTRQGCPLSPLLFTLALEPFLAAVRGSPDIQGLRVGPTEHKIAAYADDLLFFISHPETTLPNVLQAFQRYDLLSNLKINYAKSFILNVSLSARRVSALNPHFPFQWATSRIKYLGIWVTQIPAHMFRDNFLPILDTFANDLGQWDYPHISWLGRVQVLKMNLLPRLLYLFQTIPTHIPSAYFRALRSLTTTYIWRGSRPRQSFTCLTLPKLEGGLAVPDFLLYYKSCHMVRVVEWA